MNEISKLKDTVTSAPLGAVGGAIVGYLIAKRLGYDKTISVVSFTIVFLIMGAALGMGVKQNIN